MIYCRLKVLATVQSSNFRNSHNLWSRICSDKVFQELSFIKNTPPQKIISSYWTLKFTTLGGFFLICFFFSERSFRKVKRTFLTTSRQPPDRFGLNLASLLSDSFSRKPCLRFCFLFPFLNNSHLSPLTFSFCEKRTNAHVKTLRRGFLVERVKKQMRCLSLSSAHSQLAVELNLHVFSQKTSQLHYLLRFWDF